MGNPTCTFWKTVRRERELVRFRPIYGALWALGLMTVSATMAWADPVPGPLVEISKLSPFGPLGKTMAAGEYPGFAKFLWGQKNGELIGAHLIGPAVTDLIAELDCFPEEIVDQYMSPLGPKTANPLNVFALLMIANL